MASGSSGVIAPGSRCTPTTETASIPATPTAKPRFINRLAVRTGEREYIRNGLSRPPDRTIRIKLRSTSSPMLISLATNLGPAGSNLHRMLYTLYEPTRMTTKPRNHG